MLSPRVGIAPWLQEGCQDRLAGSASMDGFVAQVVISKRKEGDGNKN